MNNAAKQLCQILDFAICQNLNMETICRDIDLSGKDIFMPHLHHGLEIKMLGVLKEDEQQEIIHWHTLKTIVIPAQIVHASNRTGGFISILFEKNKVTCVCNRKMLTEAIPFAALADLGIVTTAIVNFLQPGLSSESALHEFAGHADNLLKALFSALIIVLENPAGNEQTPLVARAANYISRNYYRRNLSVEDVAAHVGITSNYLVSKFRQETGVTIRQYLIKTRLEQAELLLQSGRCLVKDAARLTGWNSSYYFSNCYHRYFGMPPSEVQEKV